MHLTQLYIPPWVRSISPCYIPCNITTRRNQGFFCKINHLTTYSHNINTMKLCQLTAIDFGLIGRLFMHINISICEKYTDHYLFYTIQKNSEYITPKSANFNTKLSKGLLLIKCLYINGPSSRLYTQVLKSLLFPYII